MTTHRQKYLLMKALCHSIDTMLVRTVCTLYMVCNPGTGVSSTVEYDSTMN